MSAPSQRSWGPSLGSHVGSLVISLRMEPGVWLGVGCVRGSQGDVVCRGSSTGWSWQCRSASPQLKPLQRHRKPCSAQKSPAWKRHRCVPVQVGRPPALTLRFPTASGCSQHPVGQGCSSQGSLAPLHAPGDARPSPAALNPIFRLFFHE